MEKKDKQKNKNKNQKFVVVDEQGLPTAFFDSSIHGNAIPKDAVKITDNQWQEFIDNQGKRKWDGKKVVSHEPVTPQSVIDEQRILEIKESLKNIDLKSIRPLRENNTEMLSEFEKQAKKLRQELSKLHNKTT